MDLWRPCIRGILKLAFVLGLGLNPVPPGNKLTTRSVVDRGGGIWVFQHCIVITRGQEERIPKELTLSLGRLPFDFVFFYVR